MLRSVAEGAGIFFDSQSRHYHFAQLFGVLRQGGIKLRFSTNGFFLGGHAYGGKYERTAALGHGEGVSTIRAGRNTISSALEQNRYAGQTFTGFLVCYPARDRARLRYCPMKKGKHEHKAHE